MIARTGLVGLRQIADVDLLIPEADASRAIELLTAEGWTGKDRRGRRPLRFCHAWACLSESGCQLDVHWWAFKTAGDDSGMFQTAREGTLLGRPVMIPSATESLATTIGNAFARQPAAPMRWIADALLIFDDTIDWDVLLNRARRPSLTLSLADGLEFLMREFGAPVPGYVIAELRRRPVSLRERGAHWAAVTPPRVGEDMLHSLELHRALRLHDPGRVPREFLKYRALTTGTMSGNRREVLRRARIRAVRTVTVEFLRAFHRATTRIGIRR
jgi:hypothetical protein